MKKKLGKKKSIEVIAETPSVPTMTQADGIYAKDNGFVVVHNGEEKGYYEGNEAFREASRKFMVLRGF